MLQALRSTFSSGLDLPPYQTVEQAEAPMHALPLKPAVRTQNHCMPCLTCLILQVLQAVPSTFSNGLHLFSFTLFSAFPPPASNSPAFMSRAAGAAGAAIHV